MSPKCIKTRQFLTSQQYSSKTSFIKSLVKTLIHCYCICHFMMFKNLEEKKKSCMGWEVSKAWIFDKSGFLEEGSLISVSAVATQQGVKDMWEKNEVEWTTKPENGKVVFLLVGRECMATFCLTPGFKKNICQLEWNYNLAPMEPRQKSEGRNTSVTTVTIIKQTLISPYGAPPKEWRQEHWCNNSNNNQTDSDIFLWVKRTDINKHTNLKRLIERVKRMVFFF